MIFLYYYDDLKYTSDILRTRLLISACPSGYYGADCKQKCVCERGECNRFRGCVCAGMHGARCETPGENHFNSKRVKLSCVSGIYGLNPCLHVVSSKDTRPVIMSSLRDIELNSGVTHTINCSASGQPAPLHGEITLVRPDKSTLYVSCIAVTSSLQCFSTSLCPLISEKSDSLFCFSQAVDTQTENNQTTSTFSLEKNTLSAAGRWLCQVKTKNFQEEKEFMVTVKGEILQPSPFLSQQSSKQS